MLSRRSFLKLGAGLGVATLLPGQLLAQRGRWEITGVGSRQLSPFDKAMQSFMQPRSVHGGALAVTYQGRLVLARGYAYDTDDIVEPTSLFRIYSLTKPVTATAILKLIDEGRLLFDNRVTSVLDLLPTDERVHQVMIQHLLQHLGGWDADNSFDPMIARDRRVGRALDTSLPITTDDIITYMMGRPLDHDPGTRYAYSNFGYCLLGRVIEHVTGQPYADYVREAVLSPLGIDDMALASTFERLPDEVTYHTQYNQPVNSAFEWGTDATWLDGGINIENLDSHGGWLASAVDMARFAASFDNPRTSPVPPAMAFAEPSIGINDDGWYYGNGWQVRPVDVDSINTWHVGSLEGGYALMVRRWDGVNWVALFNQRDDPSGLNYSDIDGMLHYAVDQVSSWPEEDLFEAF